MSNLTVLGNECDAGACGPDPVSDSQSAGALLFNPGAVSLTGSVIDGNDIGVYNDEDSANSTVSISGNTLSDNRYEGVMFDAGNATAKSNRISGGNIGVKRHHLQRTGTEQSRRNVQVGRRSRERPCLRLKSTRTGAPVPSLTSRRR